MFSYINDNDSYASLLTLHFMGDLETEKHYIVVDIDFEAIGVETKNNFFH